MISISFRTLRAAPVISRQFHLSSMAPINVGDKVPDVTLFEDSPGGKVELGSLCAGKKVVIKRSRHF